MRFKDLALGMACSNIPISKKSFILKSKKYPQGYLIPFSDRSLKQSPSPHQYHKKQGSFHELPKVCSCTLYALSCYMFVAADGKNNLLTFSLLVFTDLTCLLTCTDLHWPCTGLYWHAPTCPELNRPVLTCTVLHRSVLTQNDLNIPELTCTDLLRSELT